MEPREIDERPASHVTWVSRREGRGDDSAVWIPNAVNSNGWLDIDTGYSILSPGTSTMHDYHMHTHFCRHAAGSMSEYAQSALEQGLQEICFTPHIPLPGFRPGFLGGRLRMDLEDYPLYMEELERTRILFPQLTILCGIEADYIAGMEEYLEDFLSRYTFDLVLMSVHFIRHWPEGQWVFDFSCDPRPIECIYDDYLNAIRAGIETGLFDCVAHLDLIKRSAKPLLATHRGHIEEIVTLCLEHGMSAEINTSGTRKEIQEAYPSDDILRLIADRGLPLVPGSDAHAPSHVGFGFEAMWRERLARYRARRIVP